MSLQIQNLAKSFNVRQLFNNVSFAVNPGDRVALVGSNGSGKTTMMNIILGRETADEGKITSPKDCRIGYLPQEIFLQEDKNWQKEKNELTLWDLATQAFKRLDNIKEKLKAIEEQMATGKISAALQDEYDRMLILFEHAGGYTWQARTNRLLKGFGFPEERFHEPLNNFSGGWQMRAYFARLLLSEPDYLLLDEPTNYLDISSISFLEEYLASYEGGILIVSHDRYFLDKLANSVVALMPEGARVFRGNYSNFLEARETWALEAKAAQDRQDRERKRVERFIERFRYKASKASQVQSRIKQLEKIEEIQQIDSDPSLRFSFPECESSGEIVLKAEELSRSYGDNQVLNNIGFNIHRGDRLAIVGENGTGKTTLMRIIAGEDLQWGGKLEWGYKVHFGYFAQDEEISFEGEETIWERMLRETPLDAVPNLRKLLGAFLFSGDDVKKKVKVLSGGEKSRLGLARMMLRPCNLLLLDEPTNHLDINSREALLEALDNFPGTIILVSHDRFFLDCLATRVLALKKGSAKIYEGNYSQYLWAEKFHDSEEDNQQASENGPEISDKKQLAREKNKARKQLSNKIQRLKKSINNSENEISNIEYELAEIEELLAKPPVEFDSDKIADVSNKHALINQNLEDEMKVWESLHLELSEAENELQNLHGK
jgi:ATP-binding cassette subfamily F protein 3